MNPLQTFLVALRALGRNRLRSALTALGIIIGVAAVVSMVAIGEGAKARVQDAFAALGSNLLILTTGSSLQGGVHGGAGSQPTVTYEDLDALRTQAPAVRWAVPVMRATLSVVSEEQNWSTGVIGTEPDYFAIRTWPAAIGRLLEPADEESAAKVTVLGRTTCDQLFRDPADALGATVRLRGAPYLVVGVLARKGQSPMGQDYDDTAVIPARTFRARIQGGLLRTINGAVFISCATQAATYLAQEQITDLLRTRHRLTDSDADDFAVRNLSDMAAAMEDGQRTLSTLLASIAAVSLLVGGIGIMNIMLVSVTERTREIGLRMAVGARPRHILLQFLLEAGLLSIAGGLVGIALGAGGAWWTAWRFGWEARLDPVVMVVAVAFSAAIGIAFGLYPARKASRLDPIEALRFE